MSFKKIVCVTLISIQTLLAVKDNYSYEEKQVFEQKIALLLQAIHKVERDCTQRKDGSFWCTFCSRPYGRRTRLDRHLSSHTNYKPFICSESNCGRSYGRSDLLKAHEQAHKRSNPV